jgi:hypothetical protein
LTEKTALVAGSGNPRNALKVACAIQQLPPAGDIIENSDPSSQGFFLIIFSTETFRYWLFAWEGGFLVEDAGFKRYNISGP